MNGNIARVTMGARRGGRPPRGEPVLDRAFRILDAFSDERPSLTLTELTETTGIPLSSALRLAQQLVRQGALERQADGGFTMGLRMLEYAALAPRGHGLRSVALPYMEELHRATGQHVQLGVREDDEGVIVERLSSRDAGEVLYYTGGRIPLHGTSIGHVLLAHSRAEFQKRYLQRDLFLEPEHTPLASSELAATLEHVRRAGTASMSRTIPVAATSIAAPIFDRSGRCIAALAVLAADGSIDIRVFAPVIAAMARVIGRELARNRSTTARLSASDQ